MLGPQDPRKQLTREEKAALGLIRLNAALAQYNSDCNSLANKAITHWDPVKHNSKQSARNAINGIKKLGSKHAANSGSSDPNVILIKVDRIGMVEQHIAPANSIPEKPKYVSLEDRQEN